MNNVYKSFFSVNGTVKLYSYEDYMRKSEELFNMTNTYNLDEKGRRNHDYRKINFQRINRINKTFKPNEEMIELIKKIKEPQFWLVITEDWCGDSAQNLPYIVNYIHYNQLIDLKVISRDENLEVIDEYFRIGNPRSIPKIVGFDRDGSELFIWGPRPRFAQDLVSKLQSEGYSKDEFDKELHLWYAKNKGKELEKEFYALLSTIVNKLYVH